MNTKTFFLALAFLAMLSGTVGAATAYDNSLALSNVSISPNPVVAGGNATIRFQLYNAYDFWVYGTTMQAAGSYPLLNVSPSNTYIIGTVNAGYNPQYYTYTILVPNTTPSGTYTVTFTAYYSVYAATGQALATSTMPVSFYVQNKPSIKVVPSNPSPSTLYAGHNQTVSLLVENNGYGTARNVTVSVSAGNGVNILSSVPSFYIANLTQGSSASEPLLVSAQAVNNTSLTATITYYSSDLKQRFTSTQSIPLSVAPSAQFVISSTSAAGPTVGATDVPISFRITNTGTSAANELQLSLQTTYPVTPVASTAYVSSLLPGATANVTFLVNIDTQGVPGNYPVTLSEQWKQPNGALDQQFTGSDNYYVTVASTSAGAGLFTDIVIAVVVIVVGIFGYRRFKARGAKKK